LNDIKKKFFISLLIFITGLLVNVYFSTAVHFVLSGQMKALSPPRFNNCIQGIASDESHRMLFLCFQGFILLLAVFFYISNNKPYQSNLREITPRIKTPVSAGQKQFGSAEWISDREREKAFESYKLNSRDKLVKSLIKHGYDDIEPVQMRDFNQKQPQDEEYQDTQKLIPRGGVVLGMKRQGSTEKIYFAGEDIHTLCIGATRSGKTRTIVLQSIGTLALAGESLLLVIQRGSFTSIQIRFLNALVMK